MSAEDRGSGRLHDRMVDELVRGGAVRDDRIEAAFRTVPRHLFLPDVPLDDVYSDQAVVTQRSEKGVPLSSSSQPTLMARMLEQLCLRPGQAVLEIGTGTGYNAALLGRLVEPGGTVLTVDVDPSLARRARRHLRDAGTSNVSVVACDGWDVQRSGAGFDRIEVTVGVSDISPAWAEQLSPEGVLVAPLWLRAGLQASTAFRRRARGELRSSSLEPCGFMRMRGAGAGMPTYERIGDWTASFDRPSPEREDILRSLLGTEPLIHAVPPLDPGWFTPIALGEADAVHLFSHRPDGPLIWAGILDPTAPGLAVVESHPLAGRLEAHRICSFGNERPLRRLLHLTGQGAPIDMRTLELSAHPTAAAYDETGALATIVRPEYTFVVLRGPAPTP